ncbi:hypothetical protein KBZ20_08015 [Vulcanococcus limneticus Candia 3F8]|uniref:hypothetical protein n=1 Tax=Vulcanococcus limneticus TaxID=2170428 RepID=UPI000B98EDB5|nr:hypothetical protein [Vulcanococcus limneticus MW73D5]MCP9893716.1 hypothetical protein [Vulcanococcus limneticus Candia 3F8]MCP9896532.1 hypothetical protein [Vulcanococcus limneticus Candia 3B3]
MEGWLYLLLFLDLFSRKVVGNALVDHIRVELVCDRATLAPDIRIEDDAVFGMRAVASGRLEGRKAHAALRSREIAPRYEKLREKGAGS